MESAVRLLLQYRQVCHRPAANCNLPNVLNHRRIQNYVDLVQAYTHVPIAWRWNITVLVQRVKAYMVSKAVVAQTTCIAKSFEETAPPARRLAYKATSVIKIFTMDCEAINKQTDPDR